MNIAGVVILYHPDKSKTIENIVSYANQLNKEDHRCLLIPSQCKDSLLYFRRMPLYKRLHLDVK